MEKIIQLWPQLIIIGLSLLSFEFDVYKEVAKKTQITKPVDVMTFVVTIGYCVVLYYGGFNFISFAGLIYLILTSAVKVKVATTGKPRNTSLISSILANILIHSLYYWGGFYDIWLNK